MAARPGKRTSQSIKLIIIIAFRVVSFDTGEGLLKYDFVTKNSSMRQAEIPTQLTAMAMAAVSMMPTERNNKLVQ